MKPISFCVTWPTRILVPCDFSECSIAALDYAKRLAGMADGTLILLHVIEPISPGFLLELKRSRQTNGHMRARVSTRLASLAKAEGAGVRFSRSLVKAGKPWETIVSTAQRISADLIVLGTHGHTGIKHAVLGSVAERVVRHALCPVLTVRS